jgi:hypothetical protein
LPNPLRGKKRQAETGRDVVDVISAKAQKPQKTKACASPAAAAPGSPCLAASLPKRIGGCAAPAARSLKSGVSRERRIASTGLRKRRQKSDPEMHISIARIAISSQDGWTMR